MFKNILICLAAATLLAGCSRDEVIDRNEEKIILTALAAAALLTGCNRDEIVEMNPQNAISFDNTFVDHATRATEINKDNLTEFYVNGIRKNADGKITTVFDNTQVYREGADASSYVYKYNDTRYWFDGDYEFLACNVSSANTEAPSVKFTPGADGLLSSGELNYKNLDPETDLITAFQTRAVSGNATVGTEKVALTFKHLMSEVAIEITNSLGSAYNLQIDGNRMVNGEKNPDRLWLNSVTAADYNIAEGTWTTLHNGDWAAIQFTQSLITVPGNPGTGNENIFRTESKFMFPTESGYDSMILYPWFRIAIVQQDGSVADILEFSEYNHYHGGTFVDVKFEPGKKYLLKVNITPEVINAKAIEFDVAEVKDFTDGGNTDLALK